MSEWFGTVRDKGTAARLVDDVLDWAFDNPKELGYIGFGCLMVGAARNMRAAYAGYAAGILLTLSAVLLSENPTPARHRATPAPPPSVVYVGRYDFGSEDDEELADAA